MTKLHYTEDEVIFKITSNLHNILGNYEEEHFEIIAQNMNDNYEVNWKDIIINITSTAW